MEKINPENLVNKKETNKGYVTGIASEYLVLSNLYRLGVDAYITMGNKKSVDINVIKENDTLITIDVKSVSGNYEIPVKNVKSKPNHYVIFVLYHGYNKFEDVTCIPDFYIVPSKFVLDNRKPYADGALMNISEQKIKEYKDRWDYIVENYKKK